MYVTAITTVRFGKTKNIVDEPRPAKDGKFRIES